MNICSPIHMEMDKSGCVAQRKIMCEIIYEYK